MDPEAAAWAASGSGSSAGGLAGLRKSASTFFPGAVAEPGTSFADKFGHYK